MTRRWRVRPANRPTRRETGAPNIPAALAATYPLRCFAPQWARFDNRHSTSAPDPTLAQRQRQRRKRYKRSPEPTTSPAAPIPRDQHRQICTCLPRAKGFLNRRFEWFSLVTFFLQKKKVTRAGGTKRPSLRPQAQHLFAAVRFPSRNRRFPDRCRSPDCASIAFRCRCLLLWQKLFVLPCRRLRNNYIRAQRAHLPLPPCGGKGAI